MSKVDPKTPPPRVETNQNPPPAPAGGVRIRVREPAPPAWTPEPPASRPRTMVLPPNQSQKDLDTFARSLAKEWGPHIWKKLLVRTDIAPRSREELQQDVLLIICTEHRAGRPVAYEGAFIDRVIDNAFRNRHKKKKLPVVAGVDPDAMVGSAPDPESLLRRVRKFERCLEILPPLLRPVFQAREIDGFTLEETAAKLDRSVSAVHKQQVRARQILKEALARGSERRGQEK
jgi:DNA-directed RNA polymerase specialized sigma24 family protein